jgi:hypothetical protein
MESVLQSIETFFIWSINGGLVAAFWLADHLVPLATIPAFALLLTRAPREQRPFGLVAGFLGLLTAVAVPPPLPLIVLAMAWAGVAAITLDRFNPNTLRWRVIGGLALYAVAALAWTGYSAYVAHLSPEQWAGALASDEAASTIAQGRSFLSTISVWGLWIIVPLGYFSLLLQGLFVHPPLQASPAEVIHAVRGRPEPQETQSPMMPTWWPWGQQ